MPRFVWAATAPLASAGARPAPAVAAQQFLARHASAYRLSEAAQATVYVERVHDIGRGPIIVFLRQRMGGVDVHGAELKVLLNRDGDVVAVSGNLHGAAAPGVPVFAQPVEHALATAFGDLTGAPVTAASFVRKPAMRSATPRSLQRFDLAPTASARSFATPAGAKPILYAMPDRLIPAYFVELDVSRLDSVTPDAYAYVVSAEDGNVLSRHNLTHTDAYSYRVWADDAFPFRPLDGPGGDLTPHPLGAPDPDFTLGFVAPSLVTVDGFNTNPLGLSDPWLPAGATETSGNNIDAYADLALPDGFSAGDLRASTTGSNAFDRRYDVALAPNDSDDQIMAAVTELFYVTNWLHDWFYDSGFNEEAGNAQADNFGRGGLAGDALRAEAQDASGFNNANMSTPSDGTPPRMQMFVWTGEITPVGETFFSITAPASIARDYPPEEVQRAAFGPTDPSEATGAALLADDGTGTATDGCEPFVNDMTGAIALVDRGACTFVQKALNAQAAGAIGAVIINNDATNPDQPPPLGGTNDAVVIPVVGISITNGTAVKAELAGGVELEIGRAGQVEGARRDGTIDNGIVAHEWGHYYHMRLVDCGNQQCGAQSEGWGDFVALYMMIREGDDLDGAFGMSPYATLLLSDDSSYFGIRRFTYSTDFTRNALTFRHISDGEPLPGDTPSNPIFSAQNSEVHNAGEVWASMMHEAYVALLKESQAPGARLTFEQAQRRMADYITAGMMFAPAAPTFTEQRDAILAAAMANDERDFRVLAEAFARRGAGTGAVSPPQFSGNLGGVVESFEIKGDLAFAGSDLAESRLTCDSDSVLDAAETGLLTIQILNPGVDPLTNATVAVTTASPGVSFPAGSTLTLPELRPLQTATQAFEVAFDASLAGIQVIELSVVVADPAAATPSVTLDVVRRVNFDDVPGASATDDVESTHVVWTPTSDADLGPAAPWERVTPDGVNHLWLGVDPGAVSDERLESPELAVSATEPFAISFEHRHQFEASPGSGIYWDGGVIEITADGGVTWTDVAELVDAGYGGVIGVIPGEPPIVTGNPLAERTGFVFRSPDFPDMTAVTLDLGMAFAGQTVQLRFRVGADESVGDLGWEVDNLEFQGVDNTPFGSLVDHAGVCRPIADAGDDQRIRSFHVGVLDGTASTDLDGDPLTYRWRQVSGPRGLLTFRRFPHSLFWAPFVFSETEATFELIVSDGDTESLADTMAITIVPLWL